MSRLVPDNILATIAEQMRGQSVSELALNALAGDASAEYVLLDWMEENDMLVNPFEVGKSYLICTVTLYYVGEVIESGFGWVKLQKASWVHWTGRLSVLLAGKKFKNAKFSGRTPRAEYCGEVGISTSSITSYYPWNGELPEGNVE